MKVLKARGQRHKSAVASAGVEDLCCKGSGFRPYGLGFILYGCLLVLGWLEPQALKEFRLK